MTIREIDSPEIVSQRLKKALVERNMSQTELAEKTGYTRVYINQIVQGARAIYKKDGALKRLALALEINPQWLMFGDGDMLTESLGYTKGQVFDLDDTFPVVIYNPSSIHYRDDGSLTWGRPLSTIFIPKYVIQDRNVPDLRGLQVTNTNLKPALNKNDLAIIDVSQRTIYEGRTYALMFQEMICFRSVTSNIDGSINLIYSHPFPSQINIPKDQLDTIQVLGEIVGKIGPIEI